MDDFWELWYLYGIWTIGTSKEKTVIETIEDEELARHIVDLHNAWLNEKLHAQ